MIGQLIAQVIGHVVGGAVSPVTAMMLVGAGLGLGLVWLYRLAIPPAPDLVREVGRWEQGRMVATARNKAGLDTQPGIAGGAGGGGAGGVSVRAGPWLADRLRSRSPDRVRQLAPDLAITATTLEAWLGKCLTSVVVALCGPFVVIMVLRAAGLPLPVAVAPVAGLVLAGWMVVVAVRDLRGRAARRREEFRRALSIYIDLVAMSIEAGRGHPDALPAAAKVGTGWVFTELSDAIELAPTYGETAWEALGRVGERYGIVELVDLRGTLVLAQHDGAKVRATLIARAHTMREARIAEAQARAGAATETMRHVTVMMAIVVAGYEIAPPLLRLLTA
ncbi:MAG: hypothetical protein ABIR82_03435 [Nocardioides sp.]